MSRVANKEIEIPTGVEVKVSEREISTKGPKGEESLQVHDTVNFEYTEGRLKFSATDADSIPLAGTMRALANNMVIGVSQGFEKKLELVGVGYRAQVKGQKLNLQLGFSHQIDYAIPKNIKIKTPSQTEVIISGSNKQSVGQVAAEIRKYRPPEPYKGKGVRYADERIVRKEGKKK